MHQVMDLVIREYVSLDIKEHRVFEYLKPRTE